MQIIELNEDVLLQILLYCSWNEVVAIKATCSNWYYLISRHKEYLRRKLFRYTECKNIWIDKSFWRTSIAKSLCLSSLLKERPFMHSAIHYSLSGYLSYDHYILSSTIDGTITLSVLYHGYSDNNGVTEQLQRYTVTANFVTGSKEGEVIIERRKEKDKTLLELNICKYQQNKLISSTIAHFFAGLIFVVDEQKKTIHHREIKKRKDLTGEVKDIRYLLDSV